MAQPFAYVDAEKAACLIWNVWPATGSRVEEG